MNSLAIMTKEKAHTATDGMDFLELLASYPTATTENLQDSKHTQTLNNLAHMIGNDNLYFVKDDITINGELLSNHDGYIYTANTIATLVYDESFLPSGIVFYPTKATQTTPLDPSPHRPKVYYTDTDKLQAFMIGSGQGDIIATDTLDNAEMLFTLVDDYDMKNHTIIAPFDKGHYESMVCNLAIKRPIYATCTSKQESRLLKVFKHSDIALISFMGEIADYVGDYSSFHSLLTDGLSDGEIHVTNLQTINHEYAQKQIADLAQLDELAYQLKKRKIAKELGIGTNDLDRIVKQERQGLELAKIATLTADIEPYTSRVNGDELAHEILHIVKSHIVCNDAVAIAITLWIFFSWCIDVAYIAPIAWINAPEKRCGKTQLATLMGRMSKRSIMASNVSQSALFRTIERYKPTFVIDEADSFFHGDMDLKNIINCGFSRDNPYVWRCVGDNHEPIPFDVFGAKIISGIGKLPSTVMDRSISLTLRRALPTEKRQRVKDIPKATTETIKAKLARWADDNMDKVATSKPKLPETIYNREFDTWEILFQIADTLGDDWLKLVTNACLAITQTDSKEPSENEELLSDIKAIFELQAVDSMATRDLLTALIGADSDGLTKRWATSNKGQPMTDRQLAKRLKDFEIKSSKINKPNETQKRGYYLADFADAFKRYLA